MRHCSFWAGALHRAKQGRRTDQKSEKVARLCRGLTDFIQNKRHNSYLYLSLYINVLCSSKMSKYSGSASTDRAKIILKHFCDVLKVLQAPTFAKCTVDAIRNAFKWASVVTSLPVSYDRACLLGICEEIVAVGFNRQSNMVVDAPVELVLQLIMESPLEQTRLNAVLIYHEAIKCACAELGPEKTATVLARILKPLVCRNVSMRRCQLDEKSVINTVNKKLAVMLLQSMHSRRRCEERDFSSTLCLLRETVSKDKTTLHLLCSSLVLSENDIYLYLQDTMIDRVKCVSEIIELIRLPSLWTLVCDIAELKILHFLGSLPVDVVITLCQHHRPMKGVIERSLLAVGEESIVQLAGGDFGMLCLLLYSMVVVFILLILFR